MKRPILVIAGLAIAALAFAEEDSSSLFADMGAGSSDAASASTTDATTGATTGAASDSAETPAAESFTLTLRGEHTFDYGYPIMGKYLSYDDENSDAKEPKFYQTFGIEAKQGSVKLVSEWKVTTLIDGQTATSTITPLENAIYWSPRGFKLGFGWQFYSWGVADKKNPTDNVNPRDYLSSPSFDKDSILSASISWYPTDFLTIEALAAPKEVDDEYPVTTASLMALSSEKLVASIYAMSPTLGTAYATLMGSYVLPDAQSIGTDPEDLIAGGRAVLRTGNLDASISYLYDWDPYLSATTTASNIASGIYLPTDFSFTHRRIHRFGADVKTSLGSIGLWLETCYSLSQDSSSADGALRNPKLAWTAGLDTNFGPQDVGYVNCQYVGEYIFDYDDSTASASTLSSQASSEKYFNQILTQVLGYETEGLLQGMTVDAKYSLFDGKVTPELVGAYFLPMQYDDSATTRYGAAIIQPKIDFMPIDSFHIIPGADLCYAWVKDEGGDVRLDTTSDKVGVYSKYNRVYLQVLYKWTYDLKK